MYKTIKEAELENKRVLLRVDFNVPIDKKGRIMSLSRIKAALPTIKYLLDNKAKQIIIISHLGRPKNKEKIFQLDNMAKALSKLIKQPIKKLDYAAGKIPKDQIIMLENLRFYKEEEANDKSFAKKLASYADIYINDAFSVCHRAHASVAAITDFMPSYAGLLLDKEIKMINYLTKNPKHPYVALMGGAKLETKIPVIEHIIKKVDKVLLGGAMVYTFYKALGYETGNSLIESDKIKLAKRIYKKDRAKLILPEDVIIAGKADNKAKIKIVAPDKIPKNMSGYDIGNKTIKHYKKILSKAGTIIWNGPLGLFEIKKFSRGTAEIAKFIARRSEASESPRRQKPSVTRQSAVTIVGGGDSSELIEKLKLEKKFTHVSTGGGAFLELLAGKKLPGVEALKRNK